MSSTETEHDQLIRLQERVKIFRECLVTMIENSIDEYLETREHILAEFDFVFETKPKKELSSK